jgi:HAD superfamily hydrolase (TIGR01509 family)
MTYQGIVSDFFGVLCPDVHLLWIKENGLTEATGELIEKYYQYSDVGKLSLHELYEALGKVVGRSERQVEQEVDKFIKIDRDIIRLICELHKNYRIALCSNAPKGYVEKILGENRLENIFDAMIISSEVAARKPDTAIFKKVCVVLQVAPEALVFIDDNPENVGVTKKMGSQAILFKNSQQLRRDLLSLGILGR